MTRLLDQKIRSLACLLALSCSLLMGGCSVRQIERSVTIPFVDPEPVTHVYIRPQTELPRKVALLPFTYVHSPEKTKEELLERAARILRQTFFGELKRLPFDELDLGRVDEGLRTLDLRPRGVVGRDEIVKICRAMDVDGILTGELTKATNLTEGIYAETVLAAEFWFWNSQGELLWTSDHQESFRGGIYDLGQAVDLVTHQLDNQDAEKSFQRQASKLSRKVIQTLPSYWMSSVLARGPEGTNAGTSSGLLVLPFIYEKKGEKEGAEYLRSAIESGLARRGADIRREGEASEVFKGEDFEFFSAPRLAREARSKGIDFLLFGKVEKWNRFYGVVHSQSTCAFSIELWDTRTGRMIFSNEYSKSLAAGLIKGPTSLGAVVLTPVTGMQKSKSYQNAYDLVESAAGQVSQLLAHREARLLSPVMPGSGPSQQTASPVQSAETKP